MTTQARPRTASAPPARRQALVRDFSTAPATSSEPHITFDARPAYDFLVSLMVELPAEVLPEDAAWLEASRASLSDGLKRDLRRTFDHEDQMIAAGMALIPLVVDDARVRTAGDVVALARRVTVPQLIALACELEHVPAASALAERALAGDAAARRELVALVPEATRPGLERLIGDPEGELRALRRVLRAWRERFETVEARVAKMGERDAAARRTELADLSTAEAVERVTGGVRFGAEPGLRRVILAPTYFGRPYNFLFGAQDWRMFAYPIADASLDGDPDAVPSATVRLFKALGDDSRLRILRHLSDGDLYLTEIAERMGLSKPTVSHHMIILRAAGLVTVTETGGLTYYTLRRERLAEATPDLQRLLGA
jgi:DNA-binding transcriptional ArsR family regulator